jgi:hypothetical protein
MVVKWIASVSLSLLAALPALIAAQQAPVETVAARPEFAPRADQSVEQRA